MITKFFRYFLFFLCFISCIATFKTFSAIPHRQAKGLFTAVNPAKWYLSPLQGFTWYKRIVRNMYEFGHDDHATIKLVRDLFYIQNENFDISRGPVNPASYLEVADIGKILNAIETVSSDKLQAELVIIISKACAKAPQKISEQKIKNLAKHIVGSLKECPVDNTGMYIGYTTHNVLLAYLWQKVTDKKQYFEYFAQFDPKLNVLADLSKLTAEEYSADEIGAFNAAVDTDPNKLLEDYELAIVLGCDGLARTGNYPPNLGYSKATFSENGKTKSFSDCGETTLWNLFNWLLYNKDQGTFDLGLLSHIPTLDKKLIAFFQEYSSVQKLDDIKTRNAWAAVISGREGVVYRNTAPRCNISGEKGLTNALVILNHLLFGNSKEFAVKTKQEQLNTVCKALSGNGLKVSWEVQGGKPEVVNNKDHLTLEITVEKNKTKLGADWKFSTNHFVFSFCGDVINLDKFKSKLMGQYQLSPLVLQLFPWHAKLDLCDSDDSWPSTYAGLLKTNTQNAFALMQYALVLNPLLTTDNKSALVRIYFDFVEKNDFDVLEKIEPMIVKIIGSLPDDEYTFNILVSLLRFENKPNLIAMITRLASNKLINDWLRVYLIQKLSRSLNARDLNDPSYNEATNKAWQPVFDAAINNLTSEKAIVKTLQDVGSYTYMPFNTVKKLTGLLQKDESKIAALTEILGCEKSVIAYGQEDLIALLNSIKDDGAFDRFYFTGLIRYKELDTNIQKRLRNIQNDENKVKIIGTLIKYEGSHYQELLLELLHSIKKDNGIIKAISEIFKHDNIDDAHKKWVDEKISLLQDALKVNVVTAFGGLCNNYYSDWTSLKSLKRNWGYACSTIRQIKDQSIKKQAISNLLEQTRDLASGEEKLHKSLVEELERISFEN